MLLANPASGNTSQASAPASSNTSANSANTSLNDQLLHLLKQGQAPQQTTTNQVQPQQPQQQQGQRNPMEILQLQQRIDHLKQQQDLLQNQLQRQIDTQLDHQRRQAQQGGDVQRQQEQAAADRIFGLLPEDIGDDLRGIWEEFEAAQTPSARFAKSLDRFQPPMQNLMSGGGSWVEYQIDYDTWVTKVGRKIEFGAPGLWQYAQSKVRSWFARQS